MTSRSSPRGSNCNLHRTPASAMEEQLQWGLQQQLLLGLLVAAAAALLLLQRRTKGQLRLPPGPPGLPLFGHLFLFKGMKRRHADLYKLAETYGPIMWLRLGYKGVVVVQSPELAAEIFKHQDNTFSSRPSPNYGSALILSNSNVALAPYGPHWKFMRKLLTVELLTSKRISDFQHVRVEGVGYMVEAIRSHLGQPVDLDYLFTTLNLNNITKMGMSKAAIPRYLVQDPEDKAAAIRDADGEVGSGMDEAKDQELIRLLSEASHILGIRAIGDAIPWLSFVDSFLLPKAKFEKTRRQLDAFYARVIQEHRQYRSSHPGSPPRDFVDVLLSADVDADGESTITDDVISAQLQTLIIAGTDTASVSMVWAMAELLRHPEHMEQAVQELDRVVGASRAVAEADVANLPFLQAVVKETMRVHPAAPMLVPHYSMQAATVGGYHIPANTTVFINGWALGRDPAYWPHPERFQPGRFLAGSRTADVDVRGHHFQLLPFGAGKRICPGATLALSMIHFSLATLLHTFTWTLPPDVARPEDLDMSERQGPILHKAVRLKAVPHPKLPLQI